MKLKVPYFKQEKNTTCGVACLRMVLASYGKDVSESKLEETCETGWLGNTCGELVKGVEKFGFKAEEVDNVTLKYLSSQLEKRYPLIALIDPAILYGGIEGFGHFVVITGIEGDNIYYHDPDLGKDLARDVSDFMKAWEKFSFKGVRVWKSMKK
jgi:ABC-type bacteriocin/lantibiotic exporter with double-glycine peptidase domain